MTRLEFDILVAGRADDANNTVETERALWKALADIAFAAILPYGGAINLTSPAPTGTTAKYFTASQPGTYPLYGNVVVDVNSLASISWDGGTVFNITQTAFDLSAYLKIVDGNKINPFVNQAYPINSQVNSLGKDWYNTSATAIGEIPGTSTKWVNRLSGMEGGLVALNDTKNVSGGKVFDVAQAEAIQLLSRYNSVLVFSGFVDATTVTPSHTYNKAYLSTVNGNVLGVTGVLKGEFIIDDGINFYSVTISGKDIYPLDSNSYNKYDSSRTLPNYYLSTTTGLPLYLNSLTKCMTEFIYVKGVTFVNSYAYSTGLLWAYDKYKKPIQNVAFNGDGINGKYILPLNTEWIRISVNNIDEQFLYLNELVKTVISYGVTKESLDLTTLETKVNTKANSLDLTTLETKVDAKAGKGEVLHPESINSLNVLNPKNYTSGYSLLANSTPYVSATKTITGFISCRNATFMNSNLYFWGDIHLFNEYYVSIGKATMSEEAIFAIPSNAYYIRGIMSTESIGTEYVYFDKTYSTYFPYGHKDNTFKFKGKKLVTIGDSITLQYNYQKRLVQLTGFVCSIDETKYGVGYVEINPTTNVDLGNYIASDTGMTDTATTFVNNYGATVKIYTDGTAKCYRKCAKMAEGGETVMPIAQQSIYSRCGDSKYYKPDYIIVHAGANDRVYCNWLPTILPNQKISDITGLTNFHIDNPDNVNDYQIYTTEGRLNNIGNYSAEGDTQGTTKFDNNFQACYRGMMKKIVDANPKAIIFCIGPHETSAVGDVYQNKVQNYVTSKVNGIIKEVAGEFGCQFIDTQKIFGIYTKSRWLQSEAVFIHPNTAGGVKIAEYIASQIL